MMTRILTICFLAFCPMLRAASLPVSFNTTTHKIAAPLDLWTVNSAEIYNGLGLAGMSLQSPSSVSITGGSITGVAGLGYTASPLSQFAATTSSQLAGVISDETGSGALVFGTSPSLTTPSLGVATATSINGTTIPSSKTLVVTTDKLSVHASTTSSELFGAISDETGSGSLVGSVSPTFTGTVSFPLATLDSNGIGIGAAPTVSTRLYASVSNAGATQIAVNNPSASSSAYGALSALSDGGSLELRTHSAAHSVWPDSAIIYGNGLSGGVSFYQTTSGAPWVFYGEGTERFRVLPTGGVTIGSAGANAQLQGAANRLDLRNSTSAQQFRVWNTYTDSSNGEWGAMDWQSTANEFQIGTYKNGTGSNRAVTFMVGSSRAWQFDVSGHLRAITDNSLDIGVAGANRPRTIHVATSVRSPQFELAANRFWTSGAGSPEGVVTANPGSLYSNTTGGAGTTLYVKESGTGNTGWVAK